LGDCYAFNFGHIYKNYAWLMTLAICLSKVKINRKY